MAVIMKLDDNIQWSRQGGKIPNVNLEPEDMPENILELYPNGWLTPEREQITLPSALKQEEIDRLLLNDIATIEFELHKGQVVDTLDKLCLALSEKSLCFHTEVHNADSQWTTSRAWDNIHKLDTEARKSQSTYHQVQNALKRLDIEPEYLATLHDIGDKDLKVSGDLTDERRFGQQSDTLPWFWMTGEPVGTSGSRMQECKY